MDSQLPPLIQALHNPACYPHPVQEVRLVETHISWVLLTGIYAYKVKKPLDLGFLDFSTLEKRRFYCEEELRLNRRLAPALYLEVVPITGTVSSPAMEGSGQPLDYAVKMTQFPEEARLDRMLARGELESGHIDLLAQELAEFHGRIAVAKSNQPFGNPQHVVEPVRQNFVQIRQHIDARDQAQLRRLETWSEMTFTELCPVFAARKGDGFIRECHGDAHLANMVWRDGRVLLFDCLEFNDNLRWIDVMSELAFLVMDLRDRRRPDLARRVLNAYLEHTGDYAGLAVFRFYEVYRALVRAKVAGIRASQTAETSQQNHAREEYRGYTELAEQCTKAPTPALIITHGLSGSGKTWVTQQLMAAMDVIRLRSDVERKRLHGIAALARSGSSVTGGIYSPDASQRTYERLAQLAAVILHAGHGLIVDAAFLQRAQRARLRAVAQQARVPFVILDIQAREAVLRRRLEDRAGRPEASEADLKVLHHQMAACDPLSQEEQRLAVTVKNDPPLDIRVLAGALERRVAPVPG